MGIIIRQSIISTVVTYVGVAVGYVNLLYLFPKYLSADQIGLTRAVQDLAMILVPFSQVGISQLVLKFFPEFESKKESGQFMGTVLILFLSTSMIFSILYLLFDSQIIGLFSTNAPEVGQYFILILWLTLTMAFHQLLESYCRSKLNIVFPNLLKEVFLRILTLIAVLLFAFKLVTFHSFIFLIAGGYLINLFLLFFYLTLAKQLSFSFKEGAQLLKKTANPFIRYCLYTFLGASGILIIGKVDSLMVTGMMGTAENGIYTIAFYIAVIIELPKRAISQISTPLISKAFENNQVHDVQLIYAKSALNQLIIGSILFIGILINLDNLYQIVPNGELYSTASLVVIIVGIGKLIDMAAGANGEIIVMSKYYKVNVVLVVLLAIVTIIANYILIPKFGLVGAAIGSAIAYFLFNFSKFLFLKLKLKLQPFSIQYIIVLLIGGFTLLINVIIPKLDSVIIDLLARSLIIGTIYSLLIYYTKVSIDVNNIINQALKFITRKNG